MPQGERVVFLATRQTVDAVGLLFGRGSLEARRFNTTLVLVLMAANYGVRGVAHQSALALGPRLLQRTGVKMEDIGLWELNEAFASQVLYIRDKLGIPQDKLNVDGGAISIGHRARGEP